MLTKKHDDLVRWFVYGGLFQEWLASWPVKDNVKQYRRTEVITGLKDDDATRGNLEVQFCNALLEILCYKFKDRETWTNAQWETNMRNDAEMKKEFHEYLDRIATCGIRPIWKACELVISCVDKYEDGRYIFNAARYDTETKEMKEMQEKEYNENPEARARAHAQQNEEYKQRRAAEARAKAEVEYEKHMAAVRQKLADNPHLLVTAAPKKESELRESITSCTDGFGALSGKAAFDTLNKMEDFKQAALVLLQEKATLESNHRFLMLIESTYRKITEGVSFDDLQTDRRVSLASLKITEVNNALQDQKKRLEKEGDAPTAPAAEAEAEATATPKKEFSWRHPSTWGGGKAKPAAGRIGELLSQMQELNSQSV
jgi:chemotaxis protein histidine kinase CheA